MKEERETDNPEKTPDDELQEMAKTVSAGNVCREGFLIKQDPKLTNAEIQVIVEILSPSLTCILHVCPTASLA